MAWRSIRPWLGVVGGLVAGLVAAALATEPWEELGRVGEPGNALSWFGPLLAAAATAAFVRLSKRPAATAWPVAAVSTPLGFGFLEIDHAEGVVGLAGALAIAWHLRVTGTAARTGILVAAVAAVALWWGENSPLADGLMVWGDQSIRFPNEVGWFGWIALPAVGLLAGHVWAGPWERTRPWVQAALLAALSVASWLDIGGSGGRWQIPAAVVGIAGLSMLLALESPFPPRSRPKVDVA